MRRKKLISFEPIVNRNTEVLILGSMPGKVSLEKGQYYGNRNNHFWKIVFTVIDEKDPENYAERVKALKRKRIGLWDVVKCCYREGSRDDKILEPEMNDVRKVLKMCPGIKAIFFNGRVSERFFSETFREMPVHVEYLPSSSPLNTISVERKIEKWSKAFDLIKV